MLAVPAAGLGLALASFGPSYLRWLRVSQREHYLPGMTVLFARRWWGCSAVNGVLLVAGAGGALVSLVYPQAAFVAVAVAVAGPLGLSVRGKTSPLKWTGRLKRQAAVCALSAAAVVGVAGAVTARTGGSAVAGLSGAFSAASLCALAGPMAVDVASWLTRPFEARLSAPFVRRARERLAAVSPRVVAVTGSFGKTTTKGYIAHLLGGSFSVVASPATFNNRLGLATAVNEHLPAGTEVFVAEMGTYGAGEIAALCEWVVPEVSVITALGPVHLERMGSLEKIAEAKGEILGRARCAVINVDYPLLARLAAKAEAEGKSVWRCSSERTADVSAIAEGGKLRVRAGEPGVELDRLVDAAPEVSPGNVACAVAAALCLGAPLGAVTSRLDNLPGVPNRRSLGRGPGGCRLIDDTYNSNPAGAEAALRLLSVVAGEGGERVAGERVAGERVAGERVAGERVVVTPGMVELGPAQANENARFAAKAAAVATELVVVGRTNAKALVSGARTAGLSVRLVRDRASAVSYLAARLGPLDAVLFENDLPDHYP